MRDASGIERYVRVIAYLLLTDRDIIDLSKKKDPFSNNEISSQNESSVRNAEWDGNEKKQNNGKK